MSENKSPTIVDHWIGAEPVSTSNSERYESCNPEDGNPVCLASIGEASIICSAVDTADQAFDSYRQTTQPQREQWLLNAANLIESRSEELTEILINEIGSPITKAQREVSVSAGILRAAAAATHQVLGKTYPAEPGRMSLSFRSPLGVVAGMTPFNVPLIKCIKHSAMPLATGNTVVLLPSEETPLLAASVATLYSDAGIPAGAFNVVFGRGADIGDLLTSHDKVKHVGFTGSHSVGRHVQTLCGKHGKRVTLELGGKNPLVVLNTADLSKAVFGCIVGSFLYQGQICMSSSRIIVEDKIFDDFTRQLVLATQKVQWGSLRDPKTMIGPIINQRQINRIQSHIEDALSKGAKLLTGNRWHGNFLEPTLITNVDESMKIYHEETFGPVSTIHKAPSPTEALRLANDSAFGLCGAVFTGQIDQAMEFVEKLDVGMVHVNATTIQEHPDVPFGGTKQSGFGREGAEAAIDELTEWKWVTIQ